MSPRDCRAAPAAVASRRSVRVFLGLAAMAAAYVVLRPLIVPTLLAVLVAVVGAPAHRRVKRVLGRGESWAAFFSLVLFALCFGGPGAGIAILLVSQARSVLVEFMGMPEGMTLGSRVVQLVEQYLNWLQQISTSVFGSTVDVAAASRDGLQRVGVALYEALPNLIEWIVRLGVGFVVFSVVLFFLLRDGARIVDLVAELSPVGEVPTRQVLDRMRETLQAVVLGGLVTGLVQGIIGGLGFWLAGFSNFAIWAALVFLASFVPFLGTALVWGPAVVFLAATGQVPSALLLIVFGLTISTVDNFIRVLLIGQRVALHPLLVFLGVFGGLAADGPAGLLWGLMIATIMSESVQIHRAQGAATASAACASDAEGVDREPDAR